MTRKAGAVDSQRAGKSLKDMRFLVTGFGAYDATDDNPSSYVAKELDPGANVLTVGFEDVDLFLDSLRPETFDAWIMLGYSPRAKKLILEQYARNGTIDRPDARGVVRPGAIDSNGPDVIAATLWPKFLAWVPSLDWHMSEDAGGYLCNYLLYRGLQRFPNKRIGFVHVPSFDIMPIEAQTRPLRALLARCASQDETPLASPPSPRLR